MINCLLALFGLVTMVLEGFQLLFEKLFMCLVALLSNVKCVVKPSVTLLDIIDAWLITNKQLSQSIFIQKMGFQVQNSGLWMMVGWPYIVMLKTPIKH